MKTQDNSKKGTTKENRARAEAMRQEIIKLSRVMPIADVPSKDLALKYDVHISRIYQLKKQVIFKYPALDQKERWYDITRGLREAIRSARLLAHRQREKGESKAENDRLRMQAVRTLAQLEKDYASLQESYGHKERPTNELKIGVSEGDPMEKIVKKLLGDLYKDDLAEE